MIDSELRKILICPKCMGSLIFTKDKISCQHCQCKYPYLDGKYLSFLKSRFHWEQLTDNQYKELLEEFKNNSWEDSLNKVFLKYHGEYLASYNTSPKRHAFVSKILPKIPELVALDIGCSFGNISRALARQYRKVIAVDAPDNIVRWMNIVKEKEQLKNLEVVGIENLDYSRLPFKDNSFDLVILGMTLQWIGGFNLKESSDETQKRLIKEIYRIIKEGGAFVFYDKNRFWYRYFLGEVDSGAVTYTSLLPRKIADFWSYIYKKLFVKREEYYRYVKEVSLLHLKYRNYKHSYKYLERLFKKIGFRKNISYIPLPSPIFQETFLPLKDEKQAEKAFGDWFRKKILPFIKGHFFAKLFFRFVLKFGLSRFLADGNLIIAVK